MIRPLTSLRFIFALFVFFSHTGQYLTSSDAKVFYDKFLYEGYLGVSFFFILSGFILAYNYKSKFLLKQTDSIKFWIARVARICPLYFLTFLISIPVSLNFLINAKILTVVSVTFSHLLILQSFIPFKVFYFNFNSPSWSISNEMFFYLLFPFLIFIFYKVKKKFLFLIYILLIPSTFWINESVHALLYINPFFRVIDFILGIFLYDLFLKISLKQWIVKHASVMEFAAIGLFLLFYSYHGEIYQPLRYSVYYWIPMLFLILVFAFQNGRVSKFLSHKIFYLLGEISFGFYLFHMLVFKYFYLFFGEFWIQNNVYVFITMSFLITLIISYITFMYFEKPLNIMVKNKLMKHRLYSKEIKQEIF